MADAAEAQPEAQPTGNGNKKARKILKAYTVEFKLRVIDEFRKGKESKKGLAKSVRIDPKQIREWLKQEDDLRNMAQSSK